MGPVLFILYINDLPDTLNCDVYLYADDTKILKQVTSEEDALCLQADINSMEIWAGKWLLNFNEDKCHVLSLGQFYNIRHTQRYTLNELELDHVFDEKDLGVLVDSELRFHDHISCKINKANSMVGLIRRSFSYLDPSIFKTLFTTFVRPHLEYVVAFSTQMHKHVRKCTRSCDKTR